MRCISCSRDAIFDSPGYCEGHFRRYFEAKVRLAIRRFGLFRKGDRIAVAVSGGKDSLATLYLLDKLGYSVAGISVDEGIAGYREHKLRALSEFSEKARIPYKVISFKEVFGLTLDEAVKKTRIIPCTLCGVMRRFILNRYSRGYDALATGHNLDDEVQAVMMNLLKNGLAQLARQGPVSGIRPGKGLVRRAKPLYLCAEKEVLAYSLLAGIRTTYVECCYARRSFRAEVRDFLNIYESGHPGTKRRIQQYYLSAAGRLKAAYSSGRISYCSRCGEPSSGRICKACEILSILKA